MSNRKYIGEFEHEGVVYNNIYPPIIDKETFDKVQQQLSRRQHAPTALKAREEYIFQGKAFCGYCSASMVGTGGTGKSGKVYHYYSCGAAYKNHTCTKKRENKEFLEQLITEMTPNYVLEPERMNYIADRVMEHTMTNLTKRSSSLLNVVLTF